MAIAHPRFIFRCRLFPPSPLPANVQTALWKPCRDEERQREREGLTPPSREGKGGEGIVSREGKTGAHRLRDNNDDVGNWKNLPLPLRTLYRQRGGLVSRVKGEGKSRKLLLLREKVPFLAESGTLQACCRAVVTRFRLIGLTRRRFPPPGILLTETGSLPTGHFGRLSAVTLDYHRQPCRSD